MGSKKATVGYKYYLGLHAGVCLGPVDKVLELAFDDRVAWTGEQTDSGSITVNAPELFGGDDTQGGVEGIVDVCMGEPTQMPNAYLQGKLGEIPAYRKLLSLVFRGDPTSATVERPSYRIGLRGAAERLSALARAGRSFLWSSVNPYIKPVSVKVQRIHSGWSNGEWYPAKAAIGADMNPAHILYQCITDDAFELRYPLTKMGASWQVAADKLYEEGFGLSLLWTQQEPIKEFIRVVLGHIDAAVYEDLATGLMEIKLIRNDYDNLTLPVFDADNISRVTQFQRTGWGETVNEVVVVYTDPETDKDTNVTVHDQSNIRIQGGVVSSTRQYPGIRSADLAGRVAYRDLQAGASPLASIRFEVNRDAWTLNHGSAFAFTWPEYQVERIVCRVLKINKGSATDGTISVDAVEDVFALPTNIYSKNQASLWRDPAGLADPVYEARESEANYYEVSGSLDDAEIAALTGDEAFPIFYSRRLSGSINTGVTVYQGTSAPYGLLAKGEFTPLVALTQPLSKFDTTLHYQPLDGFTWNGPLGAYGELNDEIIYLVSVDPVAGTMQVLRGVQDTIPQFHLAGSLWLHDGALNTLDITASNLAGDSPSFRIVGRTFGNESSIGTGFPVQRLLVARWFKPWPPAQVKIAGEYEPSVAFSSDELHWAGRNRLQQTVSNIAWTEDAVQPEPGTTYRLEAYNAETNELSYKIEGIELEPPYYINYRSEGELRSGVGSVRLVLFAVRDGVDSYQAWTHTFTLRGYGTNYGFDYGGETPGYYIP